MLKSLYTIFLFSSILLFLTGCVGQPKVSYPKTKIKENNLNVLWAENKNVYADENDNVDVSDLSKDVTTTDTAQNAPQIIERVAFPTGEYNALVRTGKGTIQGQIYLQDTYGKKIYGAKTRLYLNPVTSYSRQWYEQSYTNGRKMQKADSRLYNYLKFTASDDTGAFAFYGVPSGRYYLIGTVVCGAECGYASSKNVRIATEVFIQGNQILDRDLNRGI
ncbi:MAG: carboxypeptidase regulatory-like domain-containing protein [Epsilonproteobacteria bacterium]|nr:MAG: carboxypeptidase regulatory-like domain-containing protein [Campylobacterota bacterium]